MEQLPATSSSCSDVGGTGPQPLLQRADRCTREETSWSESGGPDPHHASSPAEWRCHTNLVVPPDVVACRSLGPEPPPEWSTVLRQLVELSQAPVTSPPWWTPKAGVSGGIEIGTDSTSSLRDGMNRTDHEDTPVFYFQLALAGCGHLQARGEEPRRITPGKAFFSIAPSRHRYDIPPESPGWTFAWIGVWHPFLLDRVSKQTRSTGPLVDVCPEGAMAATFLRLVRGAIRKDFRDRFDVELALWDFVLAYERWAQEASDQSGQGQRLLEAIRSRIVASLPGNIGVDALARDHGMSRSHFSHHFRSCTGLTPAHYATSVRIHEAARMLRETRAPLKAIAAASGFANANHFCKVFRRFQQLSPAAYRRTIR